MDKKTILIIEDDVKLKEGIELALQNPDYQFVKTHLLEEAITLLRSSSPDLILLDLNLPDGNGLNFLKKLRQSSQIPVIIITANNTETDIVMGLELGANDYITKPFSLMVLRARVGVQLRQNQTSTSLEIFQNSHFYFDFSRMNFLVKQTPVELSRTEQRLLRLLLENKGATLKRSYIIDNVWSGNTEYVEEHALTVAINRLRSKLEEDSANPKYIRTVYGIGYTWGIDEE